MDGSEVAYDFIGILSFGVVDVLSFLFSNSKIQGLFPLILPWFLGLYCMFLAPLFENVGSPVTKMSI